MGVGCIETLFKPIDLVSPLTAQNNSFVQLTSVHPVWCLLYARCAFCAGRKAYVFLGTEPWLRYGIPWFSCYRKPHVFFSIRAKITTPLMTNSDVFRLLSSIERGTPSGGAPRSFRLFLSVLLLTGFHSRPTGFCEPPELLPTFFSASTASTASEGF